MEVLHNEIVFGKYTFRRILRPSDVPTDSGCLAIQDNATGKFSLSMSANLRLRYRRAFDGDVGRVLRFLHGDNLQGKLSFYYTTFRAPRPVIMNHELRMAFQGHLVDEVVKYSREELSGIYKITHPKTGQYMLAVIQSLPIDELLRTRYNYLNRYAQYTHPSTNAPLKKFCQTYAPFSKRNPLVAELLEEGEFSRREGIKKAAEYARQIGTSLLLTDKLVPRAEWHHPIANWRKA